MVLFLAVTKRTLLLLPFGGQVSGDQFKALVLKSSETSLGSWYLYYEDSTNYCFRVKRIFFRPILRIEGRAGVRKFVWFFAKRKVCRGGMNLL